MKKMLMILLAVSMVALIAMPAFAEVQNIKVSGGITIKGITRDNFGVTGSSGSRTFTDSGPNLAGTQEFGDGGTRDFYNTVTTLGVAADLTDNVSATMLLANERDWGVATGSDGVTAESQNIVALASYITMEEMLYSALTVKAGRMPLVIADGLVLGDGTRSETGLLAPDLSVQNQWDAIAGILDYDPLTVIIGTAKVTDSETQVDDDIDVYVIDAIYKFEDDMNTVLDTYYATAHTSSSKDAKSEDLNILAACVTLEPTEGLAAKLGLAFQSGDFSDTRNLDAMAFDIGVDYAIDNEYAPVVGLKYIYRSGDDQATAANADQTGWQPLFESQQNGAIYDPNTNINAIALTATAMPADRCTVGIEYWIYTLDESLKTAVAKTYTTDDDAGQELDLNASYAYTEDVNIGLSLAWFFPGGYYATGNDETATQAVLSLGVKF